MKILHTKLFSVALLTTVAAHAAIVGTTGDFLEVAAATANYNPNAYNDPTQAPIRIWQEQSRTALTQSVDLDTDLTNASKRYRTGASNATYQHFNPGDGPLLNAGSLVDVYYIYFEPLSDSAVGTVTFNTEVLGIIAYDASLAASDFLRVPGAPYPANPAFNSRGMEEPDWMQLSADRRTLTFSVEADNPGDQFRVMLAPVPEPGTYLLSALGLLTAGLLRKRLARN